MNLSERVTFFEKVNQIDEIAGELLNIIDNKGELKPNQVEFEVGQELYDIVQSTYTINMLLAVSGTKL